MLHSLQPCLVLGILSRRLRSFLTTMTVFTESASNGFRIG